MVFTLTISPSTEQVLSGIPKTVEILANQAATIYYTLDESLPTPLSAVYTGAITMPTDVGTITLSAIAYYIDSMNNLVPSAVLSETFFTDHTALDDRNRLLFFEGVVYIRPGGPDSPFYFDGEGEPINPIDVVDMEEFRLNLPESETDKTGAPVHFSHEIEIVPVEETATLFDDNFVEFSSVNGTDVFRPDALYITIDGRAGAAPQQVNLVNGPHMSLRDMRKDYGGASFFNTLGSNYCSGGSTKAQYDRTRNIIVFYYFDSNSGRWIKSIQDLAAAPVSQGPQVHGPGLVFKWFTWGRNQS